MFKNPNRLVTLANDLLFLIICCQGKPSQEEIEFIGSCLSTGDLTAQTLIDLAHQHGILPLVYKMLKNLQPAIQKDLSELKTHYHLIVQKNMSMSAALIKTLNLFKENNISALSFKGPSLAQMVYGDITLRQFGDLDILIKKENIKKVEELCISMGYKPYYDLTEVQKEIWYNYAKDMVFYHPQKQSIIEIHWLLLDADFPLQIDLDTIWNHTQNVDINKHPIETFSSESLLLYLCIHGSKHLWERIVWIKDIDMMIRTQTINWDYILVDAQKNNLDRMLLLGLYLSQILFDTPLPKSIQKTLEKETVLPQLSNAVFSQWKRPQNKFQHTKAMLKVFPTLKMKILYLHKIILKPSNSEYQFIDLPKGLYWVYYLVRPYLLLKKYLTKNQ